MGIIPESAGQHDPEPHHEYRTHDECDRAGRPAELRMAVAQALCAHCIELLGLREDRLNVEFTQHSGDEMYHPALGGFSPDWSPGEA